MRQHHQVGESYFLPQAEILGLEGSCEVLCVRLEAAMEPAESP